MSGTATSHGGFDSTLDEGQTGLLFVGAAHQVEKKLPRDIVVHPFDT